MSSDEITQIKVDGDRIGIIGLKSILSEMAENYGSQSDDEIRTQLLMRLDKRNYIPESMKEKYSQAFFREFKKFTGYPVQDSDPGQMEIKVLGPGCARCNQMEQDLIAVMTEMKMAADFEHVTDIAEIGNYGVMGTPALVINREVKSVGSVPTKAKLRKWLQEAFDKTVKQQFGQK